MLAHLEKGRKDEGRSELLIKSDMPRWPLLLAS